MKADINFDSHRIEAMLEDADFLFANGVSFADACERIGCTESALEKALYRRRNREREQHGDTDFGKAVREEAAGWPLLAMRSAS